MLQFHNRIHVSGRAYEPVKPGLPVILSEVEGSPGMGPCKKYTVYRNTQPMFTRQLYKKQQEPGGICAGFLLWAKKK